MTRRIDATNDAKRLDQLRKITEHPDLINRNGARLITETGIRETTEIADRLGDAIRNRNRARTTRRGHNRERDQKMAVLIRTIRSTWNNLDTMIRMGQLDERAYSEFGLSATGRRPNPTTHRDWLMIAEQIIEETTTEIIGIDRAGFTSLYEEATNLDQEAEKAEIALREHQGTLKRARKETDIHLRKIASQLSTSLYEEDPPTKRRTMRTFGFRFEGDREETETGATTETN